jgi:hypothetical protein
VSLDLGSKSSHALLSPRVADIMAAAGGLVQFDTGIGGEETSDFARERRASSTETLNARVDQLLTANETEVRIENRELHAHYRRLRFEVGRQLVREIIERYERR